MGDTISFQTILVFALVSTLLIGLTSSTTVNAQVSVVAGGAKMLEIENAGVRIVRPKEWEE